MLLVASRNIRINLQKDPTVDVNFYGGVNLFNKRPLSQKTIPQCFGLDIMRNRILMFQVKDTPADKHGGARYGELAVTLLDATTGKMKKSMELNHYHKRNSEVGSYGFGHGSQIGTEIDPNNRTILWVEHKAPVNVEDTRGMKIARVKYSNNSSVTADMNDIATVERVPWTTFGTSFKERFPESEEISNVSLYFDSYNKVLTIKLFYKGVGFFQLYDVTYAPEYKYNPTIKNMSFTHKVLVKAPKSPKSFKLDSKGKATKETASLDPNGFAQYGDFLYCMYGRAYNTYTDNLSGQDTTLSPTPLQIKNGVVDGEGKQVTKVGSTIISIYDLTSKASDGRPLEVDTVLTEAGKSLTHREPEGLFIHPEFDESGHEKYLDLYFCLAGGEKGARTWSLYKKRHMV